MPISSLRGAIARIADAFTIKAGPPSGIVPAGMGENVGGAFLDRFRKQRQPTRPELLAEFRNAVYCCVNLNGNATASVPLKLYVQTRTGDPRPKCKVKGLSKRQNIRLRSASAVSGRLAGDADIEEVVDHVWLDTIAKPNPWMGWFFLAGLTSRYLDLDGNSYWWIGNRSLGIPTEIWPLPSHLVSPFRQHKTSRTDNEIIDHYLFTGYTTQWQIPTEDIVHFRMFNPWDPYTSGISPLRAVFEMVNVAQKMLGHTQAALDNQARPDAIVSPADVNAMMGPDERDRLELRLNSKFRAAGYGGLAVTSDPVKVEPLQWSPADLQALEVFGVTKDIIYDAYDVPQALATKDTNLANLQASLMQHGRNAVTPRCNLRDEVINRQIMPLYDESGRLFVASDCAVPEDDMFEHTKRKDMVSLGGLKLSEWRDAEGHPNEPWAEVPRVPPSLQPVDATTGEPIQQELAFGFGDFGFGDPKKDEPKKDDKEKPKGDDKPDKAEKTEKTVVKTDTDLPQKGVKTASDKSLLRDVLSINRKVAAGQLKREAAIFLLCKTHDLTSDEASHLIERPPKTKASGPVRSKVLALRLLPIAPMRQTTDYTCGAVAYAMALEYLGECITEQEASQELGTTYEVGTPPEAITKAFASRAIKYTEAHGMAVEALAGKPVLCPIQQYGTGDEYARDESGHWVLVIGVDDTHVYFNDPSADGTIAMSHAEWNDHWHDKSAAGVSFVRYGIVINSPPAKEKALAADSFRNDPQKGDASPATSEWDTDRAFADADLPSATGGDPPGTGHDNADQGD